MGVIKHSSKKKYDKIEFIRNNYNINIPMGSISNLLNRLQRSRLFSDSFWALLGSVIGKGLSLIAGIVVARFLGSELYGEYGVIRNTLTYIAIVSTFGFGYSATKFITEYLNNDKKKIKALKKKIEYFTFAFSGVLSIINYLLADKIAIVINAPHLGETLKMASVMIIFNAIITTQISILSGFKAFKQTARINSIIGITTFILSFILTKLFGLNGALIALLVAYIVQYFLSEQAIQKEMGNIDNRESIENKEFVKMLKFSLPIALQESLYSVVHWIQIYLMATYANFEEIGLASAASLWQSVVIFIPAMLKNVMFSHLSSDYSNNLVKRLLLINISSAIIPILCVIIGSEIITDLFYGESYINLPPVLMISVTSAFFICISEVFCYELIAKNKQWNVFLARLTRDIIALILTVMILPKIDSKQALYMALLSLSMHIVFLIYTYICHVYLNKGFNNAK